VLSFRRRKPWFATPEYFRRTGQWSDRDIPGLDFPLPEDDIMDDRDIYVSEVGDDGRYLGCHWLQCGARNRVITWDPETGVTSLKDALGNVILSHAVVRKISVDNHPGIMDVIPPERYKELKLYNPDASFKKKWHPAVIE